MKASLAEKLRLARLNVRMLQIEAGRRSGISPKSISSWETGQRLESIKLRQLCRLLMVYEMTLREFLEWNPVREEYLRKILEQNPAGRFVSRR